jgi:hypothetical protein
MPNLQQVLDRLAGKKYYWSVDVSSFFNQIEVEVDSRQYLAFVIPGGAKYEYLRTPFGCKNAPAWAQQQLKESLALDEGTQDLVNFIDDITYGWEHPVCVRARELARACVKELEFLVEFLA